MKIYEIADKAVETAVRESQKRGFATNIAVVDASGLLVRFHGMEGAVPGAIDVCIKKARTASLFRTDSAKLGEVMQPGKDIYTLEFTNGGMISFGGGVVLTDEKGQCLGAVGVAGATVEADEEIAQLASKL